jgi:hypothetical protein
MHHLSVHPEPGTDIRARIRLLVTPDFTPIGGAQMRVSDLERLYDYNCWANKKLFDAVSQLTPEQFTQSVAGS